MYTWDAGDYRKNSTQQKKWALELLTKINLEGRESILDIGCGDGKVTAELAAALKEGYVVGIDSSPGMIDLAQKTFTPVSHPNLRFMLKDACELDFNDEFDWVFSNSVLHWIKDHRTLLPGIRNSLNFRGKCILQMGGKGNAARILEVLNLIIETDTWKSCFRGMEFPYFFPEVNEYRELLEGAGLRPLRVELFPRDMALEGRNGLAGFIRTTGLPYTHCIPEELRGIFINEILDRYLEKHPIDNKGYAHVTMVRLEIEAEKM